MAWSKGQPYTVDSTYTSETIVYTYDAYNNINGQYTFSGCTDPNNGVMGESNVTVSGTWTFEEVTVAKYDVNYSWDGDVPETETLPESITGLVKGQPYTVDSTYTSETIVYTYDAYNNINGQYTFSGWTDPNNGVMGEQCDRQRHLDLRRSGSCQVRRELQLGRRRSRD